jgi:hypothetical protein
MKHDDLWKAALDDAATTRFAESSLTAMRRTARTQRVKRTLLHTTAVIAVTAMAWWMAYSPAPPASSPQVTSTSPAPLPAIPVTPLSDRELISTLQEAGYGIAITGEDYSKRLLLVAADGRVFEP